jgi:hypothetical protein
MPYNTKQDAVGALLPGYRVVGEQPNVVKVTNPNAGRAGEPAQIDEKQGIVLSVQGPNGEPDTVIVKEVGNNPNTKGGVGFDVVQGPQKTPTRTASAAADLEKLDASGNVIQPGSPTKPVYLRDPKAPPGTQPLKLDDTVTGDPSTWTPIYDPTDSTRVIALYDPTSQKVGANVPAPANAKPSGTLENRYVTNADGSQRLIGAVDTGNKQFIPISADPTTQKRTIQTPTAVYSVDDNDNLKKLVDIDKNVPLQAVIIDGRAFSFDPNEKDLSKRFTPMGGDVPPATLKQGDDTLVRKQNEDGSYSYELPPGVTRTPVLNTNTTARTLDYYDPQTGKLVSSTKNPNYVEPKVDQPTLPATNTASPMILVADPDHPGHTKWIKNEGRVTASQALQQLASQLSGHVVDGNISVDEAKSIIDGANAAMTTATQGATGALSAINQGATAGAGLLNQRVQAGQAFINQTTGLLGQTKHGLIGDVPADFGANVTQGAEAFATRLGGGPEVYQAAANLVRRADPNGAQGQDAAHAYATLSQMFQGYRAAHGGQPAPEEVQALQGGPGGQQANNQAFQSAPFNPQASTAGMNAAGFPDTPAGRAAAMAATPSLLQTPTPPPQAPFQAAAQNAGVQAPFSGSVPGQNYGPATAYTGGVSPIAAVPGPSFVAPPSMPGLPPSSQHITITVPTGAGG